MHSKEFVHSIKTSEDRLKQYWIYLNVLEFYFYYLIFAPILF
jgi:hypothetical protein